MNFDIENKNIQAFEYYKSIYNAIFDDICAPLFSSFDNIINHFGYMRIFNDGFYLAFNNNKEYMEHFIKNVRDNGKVFTKVINNLPEDKFHYFPWPTDINKNYIKKDFIFSSLYDYDIWNGLNIYKRKENYVEVWCFAGNRKHESLSYFFLNNTYVLEHFINYFSIKAKIFINTVDNKKFFYFKDKINLNENRYNTNNKNNVCNFFKKIKIDKFPFQIKKNTNSVYLSPQQFKCLHYLSLGKSAKEIARILHISPRTSETHLHNIKNLVGISRRSELITLFNENYNKNSNIF